LDKNSKIYQEAVTLFDYENPPFKILLNQFENSFLPAFIKNKQEDAAIQSQLIQKNTSLPLSQKDTNLLTCEILKITVPSSERYIALNFERNFFQGFYNESNVIQEFMEIEIDAMRRVFLTAPQKNGAFNFSAYIQQNDLENVALFAVFQKLTDDLNEIFKNDVTHLIDYIQREDKYHEDLSSEKWVKTIVSEFLKVNQTGIILFLNGFIC
jgi:hypothetical protein